MKEIFGYIRVSTKEQCEERQLIALREFSVPYENIFMDKLSGKDFNRPQYKKLLRKLKQGNLLVVKVHRPPGTQLRGDPEPVADHHEGKACRHCGVGYASFRHPADRQGLDRNLRGRPGFADPLLCGADRTGKYPPASDGGHRRRKAAGRTVWQAPEAGAGELFRDERTVEKKGDHIPAGGKGASRRPGYLPALGA